MPQELLIYLQHVKRSSVYIQWQLMLFYATLGMSLDICNCRSLISMGRLFGRRHLISRKGFEPYWVLAHLSRRLTRWAYSIPMVRRPSVVHTFKLEYLWNQLANLDQILCVSSLGWGKGCIRFWGRLDQNSGLHGNRKPPLAYNGENDVSAFSRLFLIRSFYTCR